MQVEIIAIGSEVLSGHTLNKNAAFLSKKLSSLGYSVMRHTVLPDDLEIIRQVYREAKQRSSLLLFTGGLGPTIDDKTREALDPFLDKGVALSNTIGSAEGLFYKGPPGVILLPGVFYEMEKMFLEEALTLIKSHFPLIKSKFRKQCYLCLLREVEVNPFLETMRAQHEDVEIGIYPSQGFLLVEFVGFSEKKLDEMALFLKNRFETFYLGSFSLIEAVQKECIARSKTLALAESCTGGAIGSILTSIPDASLYFLGSLVVYSNSWKERFLQVSHSTLEKKGAVSLETVDEMLQGIFRETDADFAIAVSGILGPSGGSKEKPIGTVYLGVGERGEKKYDIGRLQAPKNRKAAVEWVVHTTLGAFWRRLVHGVHTFS